MIRWEIIDIFKSKVSLTWIKKGQESWLKDVFSGDFIKAPIGPYGRRIDEIVQQTNEKGPQPLWEGYGNNNAGGTSRTANKVSTNPPIGNIFTYLVQEKKPEIIVEFGTAFGVSGMYFLAGLRANKKGKLLTFDPNKVWTKLAKDNLSQISDRFELTIGTFEANIDHVLPKSKHIDMAFIDGIHTKEFVIPQLDIIVSKAKKGTIIILDDIDFSVDMQQCWEQVSRDNRFISSLALGSRVGVLEVKNDQ